MHNKIVLILYGRDECELCDLAEAMVLSAMQPNEGSLPQQITWQLRKINIDTDAALRDAFGLRIPVLERADTAKKLYWPFPPSRLRDFLNISESAQQSL